MPCVQLYKNHMWSQDFKGLGGTKETQVRSW